MPDLLAGRTTQESNSLTPPVDLSAGEGQQGPVIEVKDIVFGYGNLVVLDECSLSIPQGQVTAIVGPSGCGKSTLLKLIAGLQTPRSGENVRNYRDEPSSHPLSMVFQDDTLLPWLTTENNVQLFYRFQRRPKTPKSEVKSWTKLLLVKSHPHRMPGKQKDFATTRRRRLRSTCGPRNKQAAAVRTYGTRPPYELRLVRKNRLHNPKDLQVKTAHPSRPHDREPSQERNILLFPSCWKICNI
jgi:ABC-type glutathione transport system ATPase component